MEESGFDALTRRVGSASTRRTTLRAALGAAAGAVVGLVATAGQGDAAKRHKRNNQNNQCRNQLRSCRQDVRNLRCDPRPFGATCSTNEQCCADRTGRICGLPRGTGTTTICCGGSGAPCFSNNECCRHFNCVAGFCRAV